MAIEVCTTGGRTSRRSLVDVIGDNAASAVGAFIRRTGRRLLRRTLSRTGSADNEADPYADAGVSVHSGLNAVEPASSIWAGGTGGEGPQPRRQRKTTNSLTGGESEEGSVRFDGRNGSVRLTNRLTDTSTRCV